MTTRMTLVGTLLVITGCLGTSSSTTVGMPADTTDAGDGAATDTATQDVPPMETIEVATEEPTASKVVTLGSGVKPGSVAAGSIVTIAVRLRVFEPWHIYAVDKPTGVSVPTKLKLKLPAGVTSVGEWKIPDPKKYDEDVFVYAKDVVFRHQVKVADDASGLLDIGCEVKYQACSDQSCKPPTSGTTSVALEVTAP